MLLSTEAVLDSNLKYLSHFVSPGETCYVVSGIISLPRFLRRLNKPSDAELCCLEKSASRILEIATSHKTEDVETELTQSL